jgi:hypothetical protein
MSPSVDFKMKRQNGSRAAWQPIDCIIKTSIQETRTRDLGAGRPVKVKAIRADFRPYA